MLALLDIMFGGALLIAGRRLFWFFVGAIGFVIGVAAAARLFRGNELFTVLAGLVVGVIFALLAVFFESIAIGLAGFTGGGYVGLSVARILGLNSNLAGTVAFLAGGILGVILILVLFDWALVTISSLAGAGAVVAGLRIQGTTAATVFLVLLLAGVIIQGLALRRQPAKPRAAAS